MAVLSAIFKGTDEISSVFERMADAGAQAVDQWDAASVAASSAFEQVATGADSAARAMDDAASSADHWTDAVGSYDKSAMEAIYTTEELVELGYKTEDALTAQAKAAEDSADSFQKSLQVTEEFKNTTAELEAELEELQNAYIGTAIQFGKNSEQAQALKKEIGELSKVIEQNKKEYKDLEKEAGAAGDTMEDSIKTIQSALAAAGIAKLVNEITQAVMEMANEFSEASAVVAKATGATGDTLNDLNKSMMNVYATAKTDDLSAVAGAIGEINTRLGLQGPELDHVTSLFMDYSQITGSEVVGAVQSVTKVMKNWNVDIQDTESLLDKLSAAGQMSGISVDSLSNMVVQNKATLQQLGYSLDESIALLSMFEYEGLNASSIMMGFRSAVTNFSNDGKDASVAMQEVIDQIANMADESEATSLAIETFGSRAGAELAFAIRNGKFEIEDWTAAISNSAGTLSSTADAATTLEEKWTRASNSIKTAFSSVITPAVDGVSSAFAGVVEKIGDFLQKHPALTTALSILAGIVTAVTVALGALLAVFAIKMAILPILTGEVTVFGVALNTAIWPITLIVAGIAALVAIAAVLINTLGSVNDETEGMTAVTRAQYYELQDLNAEYERACEQYGETSEEALRLKYQVDDLSSAFESSRQTLEEFTAEVDALCESTHKLTDDFNSALSEIKANEVGSLALIQKYEDLATKTNRTAVEEQALEAVTKSLSQSYPELTSQLDNATLSVDDYVAAMRRAAEQQANEQRQQQAQETYVAALQKRAELTEELEKAQANYNAELEAHGMVWNESMGQYYNGWYTADSPWASWTTDLDEYKSALDELTAAQAENEATIAQIEEGWAAIAEAEAAATDETITWEEAAALAYENVRERVEELCAAYDEAYESAVASFEGQFGLFDQASMESEEYMNATVANAQAALESQLAYWESYGANVETLKNTSAADLGITQENYDALMAYAQDGSEQAAGLAASMAAAIEAGDTEAVAALANTVGEVTAKQQEIAAATAEWKTNFTAEMDAIQQEMQSTVDGMNLSAEAEASATATINSYADSIRAGKSGAVAAAQEVASAVSAALAAANATINVSVNTSGVSRGYASGTEAAVRGVALVGEEGPELVYFNGGEQVYTADETNQILARSADRHVTVSADDTGEAETGEREVSYTSTEEKKITLDINGSGELDVTGADEETVWEIVSPRLKDAFMSIVRAEIFEEGDRAYVF